MPHIILQAFESQRNIRRMDIRVDIEFSREYFQCGKGQEKLKEIQQELQNVMEIYFDTYVSNRWLHNYNYNRGLESDD